MTRELVELAQRCLSGDSSALREFVEVYHQQVYALCFRMLRHRQDAEDTAQESLARAVRYLGSWNPEQPLTPWVLKIAANRCRTNLGKRSRQPITSEITLGLPDTTSETTGLAEEIQLALNNLSENYRQCFSLFYEHDLSIVEISEIMEVPLGTIKTWLHRSRKQLAQRLRERGITPSQKVSET